MSTFIDANVLVRHITRDPPAMAKRATALLLKADELLLPDLVLAEVVYVLESFYEVARGRVAELARSVVSFEPIRTLDDELLLRALEVYETFELDFADAYLVASAEITGVRRIASFDRGLDRVPSIDRVEP